MGCQIDIAELTDQQLAEEFHNRALLPPGKLRAALDYQASVGGGLVDVLLKLGLVKESVMTRFLECLASGEEFVQEESTSKKSGRKKQDVPEFDVAKLRVHKKLLDKVPAELVDKYGILFFFPPSGTRAILMSSKEAIGSQGASKLQELLGVEIVPVELTGEEQDCLLAGGSPEPRLYVPEVEKESRETPSAGSEEKAPEGEKESAEASPAAHAENAENAETEPANPGASPQKSEGESVTAPAPPATIADAPSCDAELLLKALIQLLAKKKLVTFEELEVEIGLFNRLLKK